MQPRNKDPRYQRLQRWLHTCPGTIRRDNSDDCLTEARAVAGMMGTPLGEFTTMLEMMGHKPRSERVIGPDGKATGKYRAVLMLPELPPA